MKKNLILFIIIFSFLVLFKYFFSNYHFEYKINEYKIISELKDNKLYFEIENNNKYNFEIYVNNRKKIFIDDIKNIEIEGYSCILPIIKNINTYPLCYDINNGYNIDYNLIDNDMLKEYQINEIEEKPNRDFVFYNNINKNVYIALWTYKGYIVMNNGEYSNINIFNKDRYDNDLAYQIDNYIYMPNYDIEHEYNELVTLDIISKKYTSIKLDKKIDYDSYVVGNIKNKLYIYDNKNSVLYEINIKNGETSVISDSKKGYYKYEDGKFIKCSKNEYKVNKILFVKAAFNYEYNYDNGTYKIINNIKTKINENKIDIIREDKNKIYYKLNNYLYIYDPMNGSKRIFYDYELSFNNSKPVFVYID